MAIDYTRRPSAPVAPQGGVNLSKVTLSKAAPSVSLTKSGERQGAMRVNLNWSTGVTPQPKKTGFFAKLAAAAGGNNGIDLDLGCLYELADGSKGVVQALGNSFGSLQAPPFVKLDADDRTGTVTGGENMHINLDRPEMFKRILIFAMIYDGAPNWAAVDGVVTLYPHQRSRGGGSIGLLEQLRSHLRHRDAAEYRTGHHRHPRGEVHRRQPGRSRQDLQLGA